MAAADTIDRVWELAEAIRFCMLSNWNGMEIHSRPMAAFVRRDEGTMYFFTDVRAHKDEEIARYPNVCLAFADASAQKYAAIYGSATVDANRRKMAELWSLATKLWWNSPDDPNIRLLKVVLQHAEYWDTSGNIISGLKAAFSLATGQRLGYGDHKKTTL